MQPSSRPPYTPRDLQLLIPKGNRYECEGSFVMGELRSRVARVTRDPNQPDATIRCRIPINGGVHLEPTYHGELPRGMAIWHLSAGLYQFWLYPDAFTLAEKSFGEVDEAGNLERLSLEELFSRL